MVKLKDGILNIAVDGECVVVDTDTGRYLVANEVGSIMIETMAKELPEEQMTQELLSVLDVAPATLRTDLHTFQETLVSLGLAYHIDADR